MSLNFGLSYGVPEGSPEAKECEKRFKGLSKEDQHFFHGSFPWMLLHIGIGRVSKKTIPHILWRCSLAYPEEYHSPGKKAKALEDFLNRVIGFGSNIGLDSESDFFKKLKKIGYREFKIEKPLKREDAWR